MDAKPENGKHLNAAYADPPYLGCGKYYAGLHPSAMDWNKPERHRELIGQLCDGYDCWAMSLSSPSLKTILPMCPDDVRVMAWVKPFAVFKPNVGVAYAWEPVIVRLAASRKRTREQPTVRDWVSEVITLKRGLTGAKPSAFCWWLFDVLNLLPCDTLTDLFPGTGIVSKEWERFKRFEGERHEGLFAGATSDGS